MNIQEIYHGENTRMERDELRIVIDGKDIFFGEAPTIDDSIEKLKADKNWRTRVRIIQRISETTGSEYEMAVLSDVIKKASLDV